MKKKEDDFDPKSGSAFIGIGPTFNGLLSNKVTTASTQSNTPDIHSSLAVGSENTNDIKPFEVGIKAIFGGKFIHFWASIELDIGLNNSPQPDTYISNRQIAVNFAWLFHPKTK
ncbi:MAG TPA: hypothetical protein PKV73_05070 [Agriterribacter sp.]|nr:hypothetical protein [Agriterribacter sp.]